MKLIDSSNRQSIELSRLRPTQLTVGMLEVKLKRRRLRKLEGWPAELVEFVLETPIRVVLGPSKNVYVIDHHHLGLALCRERFKSAPMEIEADFSRLSVRAFWREMEKASYVHPVNAKGIRKSVKNLPKCLEDLKDDPYRSLAGFVRVAGGYLKTPAPFAEFQWADFFRPRIKARSIRDRLEQTIKDGIRLARTAAAADLPGYLGKVQKKRRKVD